MPATSPGPTSRIFFSQRLRLHYVDWGNPDAPPLLLVHGGRDHCRNWDWVAEALRQRLAHHRPGPARPRRQPVVARRHLHDGRLHLRPRPAHPSAEAGAGHHHRPFARRQHRPALHRASIPRTCARLVAIEGLGPSPQDDRRARARRPSPSACATGSTSSARCPAACRAATPPIEDAFKRMQEENKHLSPEQARHLTAARRQPERGRHLQLEVRQLRARPGRPTT